MKLKPISEILSVYKSNYEAAQYSTSNDKQLGRLEDKGAMVDTTDKDKDGMCQVWIKSTTKVKVK